MKRTRRLHSLIGLACLAIPWAHAAKTELDQTKTRLALPINGPIIIDGVIDTDTEWASVSQSGWTFRIDPAADGDGVLGGDLGSGDLPDDDTDLSADIFAGTLDGFLYIGVRVFDETIVTDTAEARSENGNTWQDDSVEIFIDGDNSNVDTRDTSGTNPDIVDTGGQFVITANNAYRHMEAGNPLYDPSSGWFAQTKESDDGYHAEFRIPLSMIGNPQPGEHIGFTVNINDDDNGGTDTESVLIWTGETHVESTYGNLVIGHRRYEALKATPPVIDGKINDSEYPNAEVVEINPFTGVFVVGDDDADLEDNRFEWRLTHDQEAIYVAVKVWDTQIRADSAEPNSEDGQTWQDDSVEIFFDSNETNKPTRIVPADDIYDGQFVFTTNGAWRDAEANNPTYGENADWWAQSTVAEDGKSYEIEFLVKKATLVGGDREDMEMGFNVNINDDDAGGDRKLQLNWDGNPHFEDTYGTLVLLSAIPSDPNAVADRSVRLGRIDQSLAAGQEALSIRNAGSSQTLTLSNPEISGPNADAFFIVGDFPSEIAPGETVDALIGFDSNGQTGSYTATLTYNTNDPDATESTLSATLSASVLNLAGPIARWSLDDADGTEMLDISGWNRHGTYSGASLGQDALVSGTSALFQGGAYGAVPGETFDSFIRFSVSTWVEMNSLDGFQTIFAKGQENGSPTFALLNQDGTLQWFTNDAPEFGTSEPVLQVGQSHHVVATWETARAAIYVDGVLVAEQSDPLQVEILQENPFVIGSFFNNLNLDGRMDDVQFYDRAISAEDVAGLFADPGSELTNVEGGGAGTITWEDPNPNTTAQDLIGGSTIAFSPFMYDGGNAEGDFFTGGGGTTGNAALDTVYNSHGWNADGASIVITGLNAGNVYQVQLLGAGDTRECCDTRNQAGSDGTNVSGDFERGNTSVIGTFTAAASSQTIQIVSGTANGVDPGLSGFIVVDADGQVITAANVGRTEGEDVAVSTLPPSPIDEPGTLPANSVEDFGGPEVDNGWLYGYRNVDPANVTVDYDHTTAFIAFPEDWWTGNTWDEPNADGDNVPWTTLANESGHPNGDNNGELHWVIRRWTSPGGPTEITWNIAKQNVDCGNGVTGAVHINGTRVDSATIEGSDGEGVEQTIQANLAAGDVVDLILSPMGTDGTNADGCDGSLFGMTIAEGTGGGGGAAGGLEGYWSLDEGSGSTAADSTGNGKDASVRNGTPTWIAGAQGGALSFDGDDDLTIPGWKGISGANPRAVSYWVKTDWAVDAAAGTVAWGSSDTGLKWHLRLNENPANGPVGAVRTEIQGSFHVGTKVINDGQWHHVVSVFPEGGQFMQDLVHYVDGELQEVGGTGSTTVEVNTNPDGEDVTFGSRLQGADQQYFIGDLDEISIWNRTLTPEEIVALANGAKPPQVAEGNLETPGGGDRLPALTNVGIGEDGAFQITLPEGTTGEVEYSTDLLNWEIIANGVNGTVQETDAGRAAAPAGYYRVRQ